MKWILRLIGLVLLVVVIAVVSLLFLPADRIARIAAEQLRAVTGRDVRISGDVELRFWPVLGASVDGLEVGNADWSEAGPMLTAENAAIGIDATALLQGEIRISRIEATSPTIRLESRKDGRASWEFTDGSGAAQIETGTTTDRPARPVSIESLKVTNATLIYDAEGGDLVRYQGVDLTMDWPDRSGPANIEATLRPTADPVEVSMRVDRFAGFLAGQVQPVTARMAAAGGTVRLDGRASLKGEVAGIVALELPDTDAFMRALALTPPGLPRGLGRSVIAEADITLTSDRHLALRDAKADLGGNRLQGAADITLNGKPRVNAQIDAGALDLRPLSEGGGGGGSGSGGSGSGGSGSSGGWSRAPIDASGLGSFDGDIALKASSINLGSLKLGATRALMRNDRSRMVFELREVAAYDGVLAGEFVLNNRSGLSVGGKIAARGISMQPFLSDTAGITRLKGAADADLQFLGSGQSVHAIMNTLSGEGAFKVGRGTITGIDLDRLMRSGDASGGTTIFDSLGATYTISGGVLRNEDLLMRLQSFEARGAGRVGLGARDIDYLFTPVALRVNSGAGLAFPIRIRGPWSSPKIVPDLSEAINLNLSDQKEQLEQSARDKLDKEVRRGLGVEDSDSRDIEDAAKDKAEKELKRGLRKLFD